MKGRPTAERRAVTQPRHPRRPPTPKKSAKGSQELEARER